MTITDDRKIRFTRDELIEAAERFANVSGLPQSRTLKTLRDYVFLYAERQDAMNHFAEFVAIFEHEIDAQNIMDAIDGLPNREDGICIVEQREKAWRNHDW